MKKILLTTAAIVFSATAALAAPHTYQVTGPVIAMTDKSITVSKGKENWELTRDANTKLPTSIKVGSKVTIEYSMTAVDVTDKTPAAKPAKAAKAATPAAAPAGK